ncbi:MAG: GNAT family N-acetyltransferase, partial [Clostridia bacterium]|nr:GNAT family N-acetyltransferase [Clostridia bacterium]
LSLLKDMASWDRKRPHWFQLAQSQLISLMTDHPEWDWPIQEMVYLLAAADRKREAAIYANRFEGEKRDKLLEACLEGDELRHHRQVLVHKKLSALLGELYCDDPFFMDTAERIIHTLIPDGNYLPFYSYLGHLEIKRAEMAVLEKEYDYALNHLEKAFAYARRMDASPCGNYSCPLFDTLSFRNHKDEGHPSSVEMFHVSVSRNKLLTPLHRRSAYKRLLRQAEACMEFEGQGLYMPKDTDETAFSLSEFMDLMDMAKEDLATADPLSMTAALVILTTNGGIYRRILPDPRPTAMEGVWEMVETMKEQNDVEIRSLVCLRQNGYFVTPHGSYLRLFCALHPNNAEASLLLSGHNGLLKRRIKEEFPPYLRRFLYCMPDAVDLFETEEYDGKSCEDLLRRGRQILAEHRQNGTLSGRAEIVLLRTAEGNIYHHDDSDVVTATHDSLIDELAENGDTHVTEMVCMGPNGGLDLGSFRFRDRLFDLDERNGGTKILVQGYDSLHFHTLFSRFPPCKLENLSKQNERNIRIKRLEKEQVDDYLAFFDRISSGSLICYCAHLHRTKEEEETSMLSGVKGAQALRSYLREEGRRFVLEGRIQGYLVYRDGQVIGWCQAKDKTGYHYLRSEVRPTDNHEGEVIAISCLVIEEEYQHQGIASVLMDYIADDARNRGYQRLEAYPGLRCLSEKELETMVRFYEKQGFTTVVQREDWRLMQKDLSKF